MNNNHNTKEYVRTHRGAALLTFVIFFLFASTILTIGISRGAYQSLSEARVLHDSKISFYAGEAGIEDAVYRHRDAKNYSSTESFTLDGNTVNVARVLNVDTYEFTATTSVNTAVRKSFAELVIGDGASFNFGLQSGSGGIRMYNSSSVIGNVFSNGVVDGTGNMIYGDVISAGPSGFVDGITATGSVWARSIQNSTIQRNAYYQSIVGTLVSGGACVNANCFPGSTDQATATMPIPDSMIEDWKVGITTTGTLIASTSAQCSSGTYTLPSNTTLNNIKIECNVATSNSNTLTLSGPVWITGDFTTANSTNVVASSTLGTKSVQVIVDNETNRATSSRITLGNSTNFTSGSMQSYVVLISMNNSAEMSGSQIAINMTNSASGKVLLYAPHGLIELGNSATLKEVTGYQLNLRNNAQVIYESGLMSLLFTTGPGGGYTIDSWNEI